MSSILNNPNALSALQALTMTQQSLATVQNQVSTGLKVATAADNSSYWSIAAQLTADSGVVSASNDALSRGSHFWRPQARRSIRSSRRSIRFRPR
jgi:flagellin